jgi:hypothetical protein
VNQGAVITITTRATARQRPTTLPSRPAVAAGGNRPRVVTNPATYWRRRIVVAAGSIGLVVALVLVMAQAGAALGGSSLATPEHRPAASHTSATRTVVRPGDSLWSVASRLVPGSDPRPVVDALASARHSTVLTRGETIEWDG